MFAGLRNIVLARAAIHSAALRVPTIDDSFPKQWDWITSESRLTLVMTGRQAGKTSAIVLRAALLAITRPGWKQLYITLVRKNTKKYFWRPVQNLLTELGIRYRADQTDMRLELENGSIVEATSADDVATIQRVRGDNWHDVYIDESQAYPDPLMRELVLDIIFPLLMTRGGRLHLLGTPPDSIVTYFVERAYDIKWKWFNWSVFDNRFVPAETVSQTILDLGLVEGSNQYQREILGLPVKDPTKLVYEFDSERNTYIENSIAFKKEHGWRFTAGVDLGWSDLTSVHALGWRPDDPEQTLYEVFNWTMKNALLDDTTPIIQHVKQTYKPQRWVGDNGGHGATTMLKTLESRLKIVFEPKPGPGELIASIGMVNTDFRKGRIKLVKGGETAADCDKITWSFTSTGKRVANKAGYHSDRMDSFRYAHHGSMHFRAKPPQKELTYQEQRIKWLDEQAMRTPNGEW